MRSSRRVALGVVLILAVGIAFGHSARGDERSNTVAILAVLEKDTAHAALIADDIKQARMALERATRMRDANDEKHARLVEGLAAEWVHVAADLVRASDAEQAATDTRLAANDAGAHADRERSLLEEGIARQGRLRAELDAFDRQSKQAPDRTSLASGDGGARAARSKSAPSASADAGALP
jgi:hypothetical protein